VGAGRHPPRQQFLDELHLSVALLAGQVAVFVGGRHPVGRERFGDGPVLAVLGQRDGDEQ